MTKKSKNIILIVVVCIGVLVLIACDRGNFVIKNGNINHEDNKYYGSYNEFDGFTEYQIGNEDMIQIKYEITTESGEIEVEINDESDENLISIDQAEMDEVLIENNSGDDLTLRINAKNHKGSYKIEFIDLD